MLRELVLKNIGWKMLSLGLAVAIWLPIHDAINERGGARVRTFHDVPAQIVSSTSDVRGFRVDPDKVSVTVQGAAQMINVLTDREIHAFVDVTAADISQNFTWQLRIATPPGVTLIRVDPADLTVIVPPKPPVKFPTD